MPQPPSFGTDLASRPDMINSTSAPARSNLDFSFLDREEFKAIYGHGQSLSEIRFYIAGIRCEKCVRKLEGLVTSVPGLNRLRVEMGKNLVHVDINPRLTSFSQIAQAIENLGFEPIPLTHADDAIELERVETRRDIIRLAVAGACAGNIMTFAFASYFGGDGAAFAWLSLVLYLPVVSYVAWPFYREAWRSLLEKRVSIDLPMAVASLAGFVFSTIELLRGNFANVYFDSISGFLFLILIARFMQRRLQRKFLQPQELAQGLRLNRVRVMESGQWQWRPLNQVGPGFQILLKQNEVLGADSELLSPIARASLAWLTGENRPVVLLKGAVVPAGAQILSEEAHFTVKTPLAQSAFGRILDDARKFSLSRSPLVLASDRWAQYLIGAVFLLALVFLAAYWSTSPEEAIRRSMALIVLACPCAMAFGTPLALATALNKARSAGLILRDATVLQAARSVKTIFFDKTGTLTDADLTLKGSGWEVSAEVKAAVLGLEGSSYHPIAFALRKAFADEVAPLPFAQVTEKPGSGVSGMHAGHHYELSKTSIERGEMACALYQDGKELAVFEFSAALKPDCQATLNSLRSQGFQLRMLSGDTATVSERIGQELGFKPQEIFAGLSATEKASIVGRTANSMMVGDGINDSPALMKAQVGIAVSGGIDAALKSAGVYMTEPSLSGVTTLLKCAKDADGLIRQNLSISLIYNFIGGSLALMGHINPFTAAVLMPISSGFILLTTWLRSRR